MVWLLERQEIVAPFDMDTKPEVDQRESLQPARFESIWGLAPKDIKGYEKDMKRINRIFKDI